MSKLYQAKCLETVQDVLKSTRNLPDIDVQRELIKKFPYHASNIVAWKAYKGEIFRQSNRRMF